MEVAPSDCDDDSRLTDAAVERMFADARREYFSLCSTIDTGALTVRRATVQRGVPIDAADGVTISVNVVEIFPDCFTMHARIRPAHDAGVAADASCTLSPGGEVTKVMRDEFIALAHAARLTH